MDKSFFNILEFSFVSPPFSACIQIIPPSSSPFSQKKKKKIEILF